MIAIIKRSHTLLLLFSVKIIFAQDVHFSNSSETPVVLNPALSCTAYDTRIIANYKNQWASVSVPYKTYGISIEQAINHLKTKKTFVGVSLICFSDKAGDLGLGTTFGQFGLNVVTKITRYAKLSGGVAGGIAYRTLSNPNNMRWSSQYNGYVHDAKVSSGEAPPSTSFVQGDYVVGVDYHYSRVEKTFFTQQATTADIGIAVSHFSVPKINYTANTDRQYSKFVFHSSFSFGVKGSDMAVLPSFIYMQQGPARQINAGLMFKRIYKSTSFYTNRSKSYAFAIGAFYRLNDAIIPSVLIELDKYALSFSYDINVSSLKTASKFKGGMELGLRFNVNPGYGKALGNNRGRD